MFNNHGEIRIDYCVQAGRIRIIYAFKARETGWEKYYYGEDVKGILYPIYEKVLAGYRRGFLRIMVIILRIHISNKRIIV